jgi:adenosylcobinamide-GDP ribazoletransferase
MIGEFAAAVSFLTRFPVAGGRALDGRTVARSARWFPLVGLPLGAICAVVLWLSSRIFPPLIAAVIWAGADAALTGALHLDGLADTADGFGGGHTREDILRIMRDHAIGAYGAVALILALLLRVAAVAALDFHARPRHAVVAIVLTPVLGRWAAVLSGAVSESARPDGDSPTRWIGMPELTVATITVAALIAAGMSAASDIVRGPAAWAMVAIASVLWTRLCRRKIGGVTGDTLGAGVVLSECLVLLVFAAAR